MRRPLWTRAAARLAIPASLLLLGLGAVSCQSALCTLHPDGDAICEEDTSPTLGEISALDPTPVEGGVVWRVPALNRLAFLATQGGEGTIQQLDLPGEPTLLLPRPVADGTSGPSAEVLVLSEEDKSLSLVDTSRGSILRYDLGSPFPDLAVSPDGRYAIAWFSPSRTPSSLVQNVSEIAVIDLDAQVSEGANPQLVTLRTFAARPSAIYFAPAFQVRGEERRVALIASVNTANLLELDNPNPEDPNVNETVVHFTRDEAAFIVPRKVVWSVGEDDDDADTFAFLLASGSEDVISLNLLPGETLDLQGRPRLRPSLNQLSAGRAPTALASYSLRGQRKLLTVSPSSGEMAIIDVATGDTTFVPMEGAFTDAVVFQAINADTEIEEPRAMLFSYASRSVAFVDLASVEARGTRALNHRALTANISSLQVAVKDGRPRALIVHPEQAGFSILDLEREAAASLQITRPLRDFALAEEADAILSTYQSSTSFSVTSLRTAQSVIVDLDRLGRQIFYIPERNTIVVTHDNPLGSVTLLPFTAPERSNARSLVGFAAWDLLGADDAE